MAKSGQVGGVALQEDGAVGLADKMSARSLPLISVCISQFEKQADTQTKKVSSAPQTAMRTTTSYECLDDNTF